MRKGPAWSLAAATLVCGNTLALAQNSGAAILRLDTGARPAALGGAYTAIADDIHSLRYNPAGLSGVRQAELGLSHSEWLLGSRFDFIGYAQPTAIGAMGVAMTRLAVGGIEGRDADRRSAGGFDSTHSAFAVGLSRPFSNAGRTANLGVTLKFLESRIGADAASTVALDLGATHQLPNRPISLGVAVLNIGRGLRFLEQRDPLPLTLAVGAGCRVAGLLKLTVDIRQEVHDRRTEAGIGTEYAILPSVAVRAGYASQIAGSVGDLSSFAGLGGGVGLRLSRYQADYTFMPFGGLGNVQRISIGTKFGGGSP